MEFSNYLEGMSGGSKSTKVQDEAKVELGKYLQYEDIININKIEGFLQLLVQLGIAPSGQVSKLNISQAQTFQIHHMPDVLSQDKEKIIRAHVCQIKTNGLKKGLRKQQHLLSTKKKEYVLNAIMCLYF